MCNQPERKNLSAMSMPGKLQIEFFPLINIRLML